jgi:alpha-N-arabinofuranosidase
MNIKAFLSSMSILVVITSALFVQCDKPEKDNVTLVEVDLSQTGQPIEKYIYGQFIEHLGRCIYGGIWAEMIQDRKFYYPVTWEFDPFGSDTDPYWNTGPYQYLKASPWQVIGNKETVTMDNKNAFVGEHTPVIKSTAGSDIFGIRQAGLGVMNGQVYEGRIVLSGDPSILPLNIHIISRAGETIKIIQREISSDFATYPIEFTSTFTCDSATIEVFSEGKGQYKIGTLSIMPANNIKGWRKDVVALMKELNRWQFCEWI